LGDSNDLAWSTLQDHKISDSDEVAWNGDSIAWDTTSRLNVSDGLDPSTGHLGWTILAGDDGLVMIAVGEGVEDSVGSTLDASSKAVVFTVVVVVTHFAFWFFVDFDFSYYVFLNNNVVPDWSATLVFDVVVGLDLATVLSFSDVDLCLVWTFKNDFCFAVIVVVSLPCSCGDVEVDLPFWSVLRRCLVSFARKFYLSKSICLLVSDLSIDVLSFAELSGIFAVGDACFLEYLKVVAYWSSLLVTALGSDLNCPFFFAESSIFPSDALGGPLVDFPFYPCLCGSFDGSSVTPVR
jgi:hypothetical protein